MHCSHGTSKLYSMTWVNAAYQVMQRGPDKLVQRFVSQCWAPGLLRYFLMPFGCRSICTCTTSSQDAAGLHRLDMPASKLSMLCPEYAACLHIRSIVVGVLLAKTRPRAGASHAYLTLGEDMCSLYQQIDERMKQQ